MINITRNLVISLIVLALSACSFSQRYEYNRELDVDLKLKSPDDAEIITYGGKINSGVVTQTVHFGNNIYVPIETGQRGPAYSTTNRTQYGMLLSDILKMHKTFNSVKYIGDNINHNTDKLLIKIIFNETSMAQYGSDVKLDTTIKIIKDNNVLFNKSYYATGNVLGSCMNCYSHDIANKELNEKFIRDLQNWINTN